MILSSSQGCSFAGGRMAGKGLSRLTSTQRHNADQDARQSFTSHGPDRSQHQPAQVWCPWQTRKPQPWINRHASFEGMTNKTPFFNFANGNNFPPYILPRKYVAAVMSVVLLFLLPSCEKNPAPVNQLVVTQTWKVPLLTQEEFVGVCWRRMPIRRLLPPLSSLSYRNKSAICMRWEMSWILSPFLGLSKNRNQ